VEMSYSMIRARIGETADPDERRRASRFPIELEARVRELGANGVDARILNISENGFQAESDGEFEVGARIWLMLPGQSRANAVVKWIAGDKLGAEFTEPVSLEELRSAPND
jgi:PilZ domain